MLRIHLVMVPRFRSNNYLRPIQRIKHVVDSQQSGVAGTAINLNLIIASDTPDLAATSEVQTGATVHGIFLIVEAYAKSSAALANCYLIIFKNQGGNSAIPTANAVGANDNKRFVIHQEMVMFQKQTDSNPRTVFKGVIKIPRGYKRFGPNDVLSAHVLCPGVTFDVCFQCHYKEFR